MVTQVSRNVLIETSKQLSTDRRLIQIVLVAFLGAVSLMAACGTRPGLAGSEWQLEELEGAPPLEGTTITLAFERSRVTGSAGCNTYFGDYRLSDNRELTIPEIGRTLMECKEPTGVMEQEAAYIAALTSAASFRTVDDRLEIGDDEGDILLIFRQQ